MFCTAIVGRLGTVPLGAVGLSNLVYFFTTVVFSFLLVVTTPRVAAAVAQDDFKEVSFPEVPMPGYPVYASMYCKPSPPMAVEFMRPS